MRCLRRYAATFALTAGLALAGCAPSGDGSKDVTPPASVPAAASFIEREVTVGVADRNVRGSPDERLLTELRCADGVVTLVTTKETIFVEVPCDRMVRADDIATFKDVPVRLTVKPETPGKLLIQSATGASIEFTTGHAWILRR